MPVIPSRLSSAANPTIQTAPTPPDVRPKSAPQSASEPPKTVLFTPPPHAAAPKPAAPVPITAAAASSGAEPPADFVAVPPAVAVPDAATLRSIVSHGEPFADDVRKVAEAMVDVPLCPTGIAAYFAPLLPHATWAVGEAQLAPPGMSFELRALDRAGQVAFVVTCAMTKHTTGALELHLSNAHVDPIYRGWALTAQAEQRTGALLQALSAHPDSRITLAAGFMNNPNTGAPQAGVGTYLHARRGYLFADASGVKSPFFQFEDGPRAHGQRAMRNALVRWSVDEASLAYNAKTLSTGQRRALRERLSACRTPGEFAELDLPGYTARVTDIAQPTGPLPLGQAFMLSGQAPVWCGVRFVNPPSVRISESMARMRAESSVNFAQSASIELQRAAARRSRVTQALWLGFNSAEADERATAYRVMGAFGDAALRKYLKPRRKSEANPAAKAQLKAALHLLRDAAAAPA